jgi:hypothetical protein
MEEVIELVWTQQSFENDTFNHTMEDPTIELFFEKVEMVKSIIEERAKGWAAVDTGKNKCDKLAPSEQKKCKEKNGNSTEPAKNETKEVAPKESNESSESNTTSNTTSNSTSNSSTNSTKPSNTSKASNTSSNSTSAASNSTNKTKLSTSHPRSVSVSRPNEIQTRKFTSLAQSDPDDGKYSF